MYKKVNKIIGIFLSVLLLMTGCTQNPTTNGKFDMETEVVVVGGGGAGLTAAISAAEKGSKVILLEKLAYMGGATMLSARIIPAAGTELQANAGIEDSPTAMARDILRPAHYSQDKKLVNLIADNSADMVKWLGDLGVRWNLQTNVLYKGQTQYRMHQAEEQGAEIAKVLIDKVSENDSIQVLLETPGTGFITNENGDVIGVTAKDKNGKELRIKANAVVLATSGFAANKEMLQEYIPNAVDSYPVVAPGATGDGILWGEKLGAKIDNMTAFQGYGPISNKTKKTLGTGILYSGGILINKDTDRFTDEYLGYSELGSHIINQPEGIAYMIFDSNIAGTLTNLDQMRSDGILFEGNTVEDLADEIGLNKDKLVKEFNNYIVGIETGEDLFNRTKLPKSWDGPFYAIEVTSDIRHTQGGLVVDENSRVIKKDGKPINGLFAAGGVTAGFSSSGGPAYMSGNGLLQAFILGRIAGQNAASYK